MQVTAAQVVGNVGAIHQLLLALPAEHQQGLIQRLGRDVEMLFAGGIAVGGLRDQRREQGGFGCMAPDFAG
ncbi:hypothetical protein [Methylomonas sp. ZR1]|uniref:hypothetical protein n=1 Tax=Methylomonas sp. ZR1 TaxID=1797072 RepID=UPI0020A4A714|nr:hypothetical protein [Methylomonas sp. ZR1]